MSASAAAGQSSAAALAPPATAAGSVFVKRAGVAYARFAPVEIFSGDSVGHLATRASLGRGWAVDAVDLALVRTDRARFVESGDESEGVGDALFSGDKLADVGVVDGAFLLARLLAPTAAAASG